MTSQTLKNIDKSLRPSPEVVCATCPNSMWFKSTKEVQCYCRIMYLVSWSSSKPNEITACDGLMIGQEV